MGRYQGVNRQGVKIKVLDKHLVIAYKRRIFGLFLPKTTSIPFRNIVEVKAQSGILTIRTSEGKTRVLHGMEQNATYLRDAILENLK